MKKKEIFKIIFFSRFTFCTFSVFILTQINIFTQSQGYVSKKAGICFRTDDNHAIEKYLEYAAIFNNYNQKFCLAINLSNISDAYVEGLAQVQNNGHEIMDHTPNHVTNYFSTILPASIYQNHPGVYRISGKKVELKYLDVNTSNAKRNGFANINGDVISSSEAIFSGFAKSDCYLYFPAINRLVYINSWIDPNTVKVTDFWLNEVNIGDYENIQFYNFDYYNVHITNDGIKAMAQESIRLSEHYGLDRPYTWIHPGGNFPHISRCELKEALAGELNYKASDAKPFSMRVFNESNADNDKQFGMEWGHLQDDAWSFDKCIEVIADKIAKHIVLIGHSHFSGLLGGWSGFLLRTEQLIQWCIQNDIPIRTYSEWADILYNQIPDPYENVFPPLNVDLDLNGIPDGYNSWEQGILDNADGAPTTSNYSYSISRAGNICFIAELGGIEKGENDFEIWTKGSPGNKIEVTFTIGSQTVIFRFPAANSEWTKFNLSQSETSSKTLIIPQNISRINVTIRCSNYNSGEVKVSGMKLSKPCVSFSGKVFLEGPFNKSSHQMNTSLNSYLLLNPPNEQDHPAISSISPDIVDWVLIELRSNASGPAAVSKNIFLDKNGNLIDNNGTSQIISLNAPPGEYYIIIKHRNHLSVMSTDLLSPVNNILQYDFTLGNGCQFYPGNCTGAKELEEGIWGMIAGDVNESGSITVGDITSSIPFLNQPGYMDYDINLSGGVTVGDLTTIIPNLNKATQAPN